MLLTKNDAVQCTGYPVCTNRSCDHYVPHFFVGDDHSARHGLCTTPCQSRYTCVITFESEIWRTTKKNNNEIKKDKRRRRHQRNKRSLALTNVAN